MKKFLSIMLSILMLVTSVPFALAAGVSLVINMTDSYGDGWNGSAIQVGTVSGGEFTKIADVTFDEGSTATYETVISDENAYAFRWTKGSFPHECRFSIVIGGVTVFETSDCSSYADGDYIYIWCNHSFIESTCSKCGLECGVDFAHTIDGGNKCTVCGFICSHSYTNHYCKNCKTAENGYYAGACGAENINDAIWSLDSQGTLTISGTGKYHVEYSNAPWLAYKSSIKDVVIEEGITNIWQGSFYEVANAVSLSIPSTVNEIDTDANNYFDEIKLAEGNSTYALIDGVLFNADKTKLIMYPARKADETYTVPAGVLILATSSFSNTKNLKTINISDDVTTIDWLCFCRSSIETVNFGINVNSIGINSFSFSKIKNIVLPEKLTEIPDSVFYDCIYLENLVIGSNVTSIGGSVINYCDALEAVHFTGTEAQWEAIAKPESETDKINTIPVHFGTLEEKAGRDATCADDGHAAGLYCAECDDYVTGEIIPATGACADENNDNICDICNALIGAPKISVGGTYVNGDNYTDILGEADEGATAHYLPGTNTLVLDGFSYEGEDFGITCDGSLNIEVKGENKIVAADGLCIYAEDDTVINIGGTGKLDIVADSNGIYADSDNEANIEINIKESATLNIDSESDGMDIDGKKAKKITVSENGSLNIKAVSEGITVSETSESVEILVKDNGTFTVDGEDECIYIVDTAKATLTFTDNAKVSLVNNDEEGIYISALESETVKVSGNADVYIDVEEQGVQAETVIVDGGSLKAHSKKNYEGILAADVTVNAGKLIVSSEDDYAISADSIKITGGTLVAGNSSAEHPVFDVAPDFSEYSSEYMVLASEKADATYLVEYDSANAENYRVITIQCKHELDGKVCKKCGFECGVDCGHYLEEGAVCAICGSFVYAITHQPTEAEPYVGLSDDTDASYQWYTVEENTSEITDENAGTVSYDWGESSYDAEAGWTGVPYQEDYSGQYFFTVAMKAGETVTVEVTGDFFSGVGLYDYDSDKNVWKDAQEGVTTYELTVESDGNYAFYTYVNSGVVTVKAHKTTVDKNAIDGENSAELKNPVIGNNYFCEVTFADSTTEMSDTFEVTNLHECDFTGEWKYDADKHWKECTVDGCSETSEEAEHTYTDGKCECGYGCPHEWGEGVLTRPIRITTTDWDDGYYTYTCSACGHYYQETVKRADYSVLDAVLEDFIDAMYDTTLLDSIKNELEVIYFDNIKVLYGDYIESEQAEVDALVETMTQKLAEVEAGVADGSALKPDYTEGDALINGIIEQFYDKGITYVDEIIAEFDTLYNEYLAIWHKPETTKPQVDEIVEELKALKEKIDKGTEDGTLVKADYTEIDEAIASVDEALENATISDEMSAELEDIKADLEDLKENEGATMAYVNELLERAETVAEKINNCAKGVHSFTKYEEVTAPECGKAGLEKAVCDHGCGATDEREIPALEHIDEDGDFLCDHGCGHEFEKPAEPENPCEDCGKVHKNGLQGFLCFVFKLVKMLFESFKA